MFIVEMLLTFGVLFAVCVSGGLAIQWQQPSSIRNATRALMIAFCTAGAAIVGGVFWKLTNPEVSSSSAGNLTQPLKDSPTRKILTSRAFEPLSRGDRAPPIDAEGWLNGPPPMLNEVSGKQTNLIVLDIWASWCPVCQVAPPSLIELYKEFHHQNVQFISLTDASRNAAEQLIRRFAIVWPSGFGASGETLAAFGAFRREALSGREVNPIVYLIGADGRSIWNDRNSRPNHDNFSVVCAELRHEIENELSRITSHAAE